MKTLYRWYLTVLLAKVPGICEVQVPGVVWRRASLRQDREGGVGGEANQRHWLQLEELTFLEILEIYIYRSIWRYRQHFKSIEK